MDRERVRRMGHVDTAYEPDTVPGNWELVE